MLTPYESVILIFLLVLIESDWNLKEDFSKLSLREANVLIESDWNLKNS